MQGTSGNALGPPSASRDKMYCAFFEQGGIVVEDCNEHRCIKQCQIDVAVPRAHTLHNNVGGTLEHSLEICTL